MRLGQSQSQGGASCCELAVGAGQGAAAGGAHARQSARVLEKNR